MHADIFWRKVASVRHSSDDSLRLNACQPSFTIGLKH